MGELLKSFEFPELCQNCPAKADYSEDKQFIETANLPQEEVDRRMAEDLVELEASISELSEEAFKRPCEGAMKLLGRNGLGGWMIQGYECSIINEDMAQGTIDG